MFQIGSKSGFQIESLESLSTGHVERFGGNLRWEFLAFKHHFVKCAITHYSE